MAVYTDIAAEILETLEPAEPGFYTLRSELRLPDQTAGIREAPRFIVTGEISCIYKRAGRTRKVHHVILLPGLDEADMLARRLEAIGNIHSDGRPILGLDSEELLKITLDACPEAMLIPAHIWTPHFAMFGAFSGFDTVEECFGDMARYIHAVETGLSSDPPMNWQVSSLDRYTLVSNSDAHSPAKLGREANLLECGLDYPSLKKAIETGKGFAGTLEFFPEEGKYHFDGHRNCGVSLDPVDAIALGGICPVCGKKLTIGVQHRVEDLADRALGTVRSGAKPYESIVPLPELIGACIGTSAASKKVQEKYQDLLRKLGPEFYILRQAPQAELEQAAGVAVALGILRMRQGRVTRIPGFDGEYGVIRIFEPDELEELNGQTSFLKRETAKRSAPARRALREKKGEETPASQEGPQAGQLNREQRQAVEAQESEIAVVAGPGTGKTKTLVARIAYLVEQGVKPARITAVTFTNQAAQEMRQRLERQLGKASARAMTVGTFHSICMKLLGDVTLLGDAAARRAAAQVMEELGLKGAPGKLLEQISREKAQGVESDARRAYEALCREMGMCDFDDLLLMALEKGPGKTACFEHLLVDEFQDINPTQYQLVRQWHQAGKSLFVIGDPDQAIYGFRGADARCFELLAQEYPGLRRIVLTENYRSTPQVLACAKRAIEGNPGGERVLRAHRPQGEPVRLIHAATGSSQAVYVAKEIARRAGGLDMLTAGEQERERQVRSFDDFAVLARTHRALELTEEALRKEGIPSVVIGRESYLEAKEVRAALSFFRALMIPQDMAAMQEALALQWDCPADLAASAAAVWRETGGSVPAARERLGTAGHHGLWLAAAEDCQPRLKDKPLSLLEHWQNVQGGGRAFEQLLGAASFYKDLAQMMETLQSGEEGDLARNSGKACHNGAVRLMTLHGAKGLEFPVVFLIGLTRGEFPLERKTGPVDPEEERRLFFVGITRAKQELVMTYAGEESLFAKELTGEVARGEAQKPRPQVQQLSFF